MIIDNVDEAMNKWRAMKRLIDLKTKAKADYRNIIKVASVFNACNYCVEMKENIVDGDTVMISKREPKAFCTEAWHETFGEVQKIDILANKMLFIGYNNLLDGFTLTKICPRCHRIICVKEF